MGCPDEATFRGDVESRSPRPIAWLSEGDARKVSVRIDVRPEGVRGALELALTNRERAQREVFAATCAEVASGLALIVALAIDQEVARPEPLRAPSELPPRPLGALPVQRPSPARLAPRLEIQTGPAFGVLYGPAPVALVTLGATLAARYDTATWFSPTAYLTPLYAKTGVSGVSTPLASFTWAAARLDACPAFLRLAESVGVLGCVAWHLGETIVEGQRGAVPFPASAHRIWADMGLSLRLELTYRSWFADISSGGFVVLTRDQYLFTLPPVLVHSVPNYAYSGLFSLGVRL